MLMRAALCVIAGVLLAACGGSSSDSAGSFQLIQFLEAGKDSIPRNRELTFIFSAPVAPGQDLNERLKILNVQTGTSSDFSRAIGVYTVLGERIIYTPRLPQKDDRSDAGFRPDANYHVFLKAGADGLISMGGGRLETQQEFLFDTSEFFEDPNPSEPPRALGLVARDPNTGDTIDISRLDPRPGELALLDNDTLIQAGRVIEPGTGPNLTSPWQFDIQISEPVDPASVTTDNVRMFEIRSNAFTTPEQPPSDDALNPPGATPGHYGTVVNFKVALNVETIQLNNEVVFIRVKPLQTLVDNTRYRLEFGGAILGLDFRKTFIGENGLTGDGQTEVAAVHPEPGGLGYTTEFLVYNRPAVTVRRTVLFSPIEDGIYPEQGQTTLDETLFNSALYDPPSAPGTAVGFLGAFGQGGDDLAVGPLATQTLDTGDTPNDFLGNPFQVFDLDPNDTYNNSSLPTPGFRSFDSFEPTEFSFGSIAISSGATLNVIGVNPCRLTCAGLVQINGTINAAGGAGGNGSQTTGNGVTTAPGKAGPGGPGGWAGGQADSPVSVFNGSTSNACTSFDTYLQNGAVPASQFPWSKKGTGPGRGNQGGECYNLGQQLNHTLNSNANTGTGGGGASHATKGVAGDDKFNVGGATGSAGHCVQWGIPSSSVIGVRGQPGPVYGDREVFDVLMGGSGGGAGGGAHGWYNAAGGVASGGGGGGGGGFLEILSAGPITVASGTIDVSGGDGGKGAFQLQNGNSWSRVAGSGGGGAGGSLSLVSGQGIELSNAVLDATGGAGGVPPDSPPVATNCTGCNGGGDGGKGFIFLMDPDGIVSTIPGVPSIPGNYDNFAGGVLSVRTFDANRFGGVSAVTELFNVLAANPTYQQMLPGDVVGKVNGGQSITIYVSSASFDPLNPLKPLLSSEIASFEIAVVTFGGAGANVTITGDMSNLNPGGRYPFARVQCQFTYTDPKEAALGPFSSMDEVTITVTFN